MNGPQELKLLQPLPRNRRHVVLKTDRRSMSTSVAFPFADFNVVDVDDVQVLLHADQRLAGPATRTVRLIALVFIVAIW